MYVTPTYIHTYIHTYIPTYNRISQSDADIIHIHRECGDVIHTINIHTGQKASFLFRSGVEYP